MRGLTAYITIGIAYYWSMLVVAFNPISTSLIPTCTAEGCFLESQNIFLVFLRTCGASDPVSSEHEVDTGSVTVSSEYEVDT